MQPPKEKACVVKRISLPIVLQKVVHLQRKAEKKEEASGSKVGNRRVHKRTQRERVWGWVLLLRSMNKKSPLALFHACGD